MSDNPVEIKGDVKHEPKDLVMTITMKPEGGIEVHGPGNGDLYNEPICLFMLKKAERFIEIHNSNAQKSKIIKGNGKGIMSFVRGER